MTKKRLSKQEKNQKVVEELINKMFYIAGHNISYEDIKDRKDSWYQEWEMTKAQNDEWQLWGTEFIRKNLRINKHLAEREMAMIGLMWGLKFSDWEQ
jgi:hypothetical protein